MTKTMPARLSPHPPSSWSASFAPTTDSSSPIPHRNDSTWMLQLHAHNPSHTIIKHTCQHHGTHSTAINKSTNSRTQENSQLPINNSLSTAQKLATSSWQPQCSSIAKQGGDPTTKTAPARHHPDLCLCPHHRQNLAHPSLNASPPTPHDHQTFLRCSPRTYLGNILWLLNLRMFTSGVVQEMPSSGGSFLFFWLPERVAIGCVAARATRPHADCSTKLNLPLNTCAACED